MSPRRKFFVVIMGCGRLGSYLANRMSRDGHSVVVIDIQETAFRALSSEFSGFFVEGDATESAVMKQAKVDKADLVIATTSQDNVNLMAAQVAKKLFNVPRVIARVYDPQREAIYRSLGIETISPTSITGDVFLEYLMMSYATTEVED